MSHAAGRIARLNLHHGTLNAVFLPAVLRFNAPNCEEKYERIRQAIGLAPGADIVEAITAMNADIGLPSGLQEMGVKRTIFGDDRLRDEGFVRIDQSAHRVRRRLRGYDPRVVLIKPALRPFD